jgi:hypothetical protein
MDELIEALKQYIQQNNIKKISIGNLKIVEDRKEKISESMYKLEFLVTLSDVYSTKFLIKKSEQRSFENASPQITMQPQQYIGESLLDMDEIVKSASYSSMTKFNLEKKKDINQSYTLRLPKEVLKQYLGDQEFLRCKTQKGLISTDFMMLCNKGVETKEMLLITKNNYDIFQSMNHSAKKFLEYYDEKYNLDIVSVNPGTFIIKGIPHQLRCPGQSIVFYADKQMYVKMIRFGSNNGVNET